MFRLLFNRTLQIRIATWLTTWLTVAALMLRAIVPDGYMPNQALDSNGFIFQLCSTNGVKLVQFDLETGEYTELESSLEHDPTGGEHAGSTCPYSISLLAVATPLLLEFFRPAYGLAFTPLPDVRAPPQLHALPPLPARGPPTLLHLT